PMNWAHEPQEVACKTASQAWNIAESREPPVPRPPLLMHPASAAVPAATRAPANTTDVIIKRLNLRIGSLLPSKTKKTASRVTLPEIAVLAHWSVPHFRAGCNRFFRSRGRPVTGDFPHRPRRARGASSQAAG